VSTRLGFLVSLSLRDAPVLVVGGGAVARGRCEQLLEAGAQPRVVARKVGAELEHWAQLGRLTLERRAYRPEDVVGARLVFTAVDDAALSRAICDDARRAGAWVNAADLPDLCDFALPSVGRQGPITLAVTTAGHAPALAAQLRRQLMQHLTPRHAHLARLCGWLRSRRAAGPNRMALLKAVVEGDVGTRLVAGERRRAFEALRLLLHPPGAEPGGSP
jgi:precorrin-2 dehydrogenase/sirohydrochlorin ferrochelatase